MWHPTRIATALALGAAACLASPSIASAEVQLTIQDGRVSLVANDATLRQILMAWSAVGQTTIVNAERVSGEPMTLQLIGVPEEQALETLLRSLSGYIAAPRAAAVANLSRFDRIIIMPTIAPPLVAAASARAPFTESRDQAAQPSPNPTPVDQMMQPSPNPTLDEGDGLRAARSARAARAARSRVSNGFFQADSQPDPSDSVTAGTVAATPGVVAQPDAAPPVATYPGGQASPVGGVSVPGMIVAPPPQPGQPSGASRPPRRPGSQR
jgi:hypothetical protein